MRLLNPPSMFFSSIPYKVVMHLLQGRVRVGLLPCAALMLTIDYSPETRKEQQQHHGAPYKVATNPAAEPACRWKIMCMDGLLCAGKRSSGFMPVVPAWTEDRMQNAPPLPSASSKTISLQQGGRDYCLPASADCACLWNPLQEPTITTLAWKDTTEFALSRKRPLPSTGYTQPSPAGERCAQGYLLSFFSHLSFFL